MPIPSSCASEGGGGGGGTCLSSEVMPKNFHTASKILPSAKLVNVERTMVTDQQMASRLRRNVEILVRTTANVTSAAALFHVSQYVTLLKNSLCISYLRH